MNELIFLLQTITVSLCALGALYLGKEALVTFICIQSILANLFVIKQTTLFGLNATCSDAFAVGATLGLNLLQEYFGRTITRKAIWLNFFFLVFYAITSQIHLAYAPSTYASFSNFQHSIIAFFLPLAFQFILNGAVCQAKNLKATRISNKWHVTIHELVQAACFFNCLGSRLEHEMVRIAKHKLQTELTDGSCVNRLECAICSHSDEIWRVYDAVWGMDPANTGP